MRKRKYPTSDDFVIAAIKKQLELAELPLDLYLTQENWYTNEISYPKYTEFKQWWYKEAKLCYNYSSSYLHKAWGWFDLAYGLKVPIQGYE
jgi:hypothetical protein